MIEIYQREDGDVELVGQLEDGEYTGDESLSYISEWDEERILQSLDGPYTFATRSEEKSRSNGSLFQKAEWEPYVGPQGGSGWRNVENGEVVYDDEPPGGIDLPDEFEEQGLELDPDVDIEDISEDDLLLAVEDGDVVLAQADELSANSEWFGVLDEIDEQSQEEEDYEEYFSEGDEVDLELIQPGEDGREQIEDATVTGTTDTGLFVEYEHPESGYDESHHVPWDEVADEELQSLDEEDIVTQDPSSLTPGAEVEIQIGADSYEGEITESLGEDDDWDYRFEGDGEDFFVFEDDIKDVLEDGDIEDDELSTGEWEERDPSELANIPEGTEVSVETMTETVTGEFEGPIEGGLVEEWSIDGKPFTVDEILEPDTELYVNEESIPEDDDDGDDNQDVVDDINELLSEDPVITQQVSEDVYGQELVDEAADVWDLPKATYNVDPAEVMISDVMDQAEKIPGVVQPGEDDEESEFYDYTLGGFLKELPEHTMPGDVHSLLEAAELETEIDSGGEDEDSTEDEISEEEEIVDGEFDWKNVEQVPEGTYVEMTVSGDKVEGTLIRRSNLGIEVELENGDRETFTPTGITSGRAFEEKPEDFDLSQSPDKEELREYAESMQLGQTAKKSDVGRFLAPLLDKDVSGEDVYDTIVEVSGGDPGPADSIMETMVRDQEVDLFSEALGQDVPLARDRDTQNAIGKVAFKMFEENHPEYAEYRNEIEGAVSDWSGSSKNAGAAPLWAVAVENGENNVPRNIANEIDNIDPEVVDATRAYVEESREVLRDMFGDSVQVFRGMNGGTGMRVADDAKENGETDVDHRAIASWTIAPDTAKGFAHNNGPIVSQEVDIDDVYMSFSNSAGFGSEFEMITAGGMEEYDYVEDPSEEDMEPGTVTVGRDYENDQLFADTFERFQELSG